MGTDSTQPLRQEIGALDQMDSRREGTHQGGCDGGDGRDAIPYSQCIAAMALSAKGRDASGKSPSNVGEPKMW